MERRIAYLVSLVAALIALGSAYALALEDVTSLDNCAKANGLDLPALQKPLSQVYALRRFKIEAITAIEGWMRYPSPVSLVAKYGGAGSQILLKVISKCSIALCGTLNQGGPQIDMFVGIPKDDLASLKLNAERAEYSIMLVSPCDCPSTYKILGEGQGVDCQLTNGATRIRGP